MFAFCFAAVIAFVAWICCEGSKEAPAVCFFAPIITFAGLFFIFS